MTLALRALLVLAVLLVPACGGAEEPVRRVVAVGDLHGDLDQSLAALRLAGVVDAGGHWSGGEAILVQTGDVTDRGPDSRQILDLLRRLSTEAAAAGGRVIPLLGNHEVMNLQGDWRYVHPGDVAAFGDVTARRAAFSLDGPYGAWLAQRDAVALVEDTVFAHGGIGDAFAALGVAGLNTAVRDAIRAGGGAVLGPEGPLWYRGLASDPEPEACAELERSLDRLGAVRMVVGHTTRRDGRIASRCGGRLHVIDVGISRAYGGHLAVWEQTGGDARALTADGPVDLEDPPRSGR